ncbi:helix-turn-helix domain-containing protein [Candidatus Woesearchaeota archaeon]|nr:helix-turn-helix domain-containing protein [Candidatus Woesearchaeota archaeon]
MESEQANWLKLYDERESRLRKLYVANEDPYVRGLILSALERIVAVSDQLPSQSNLYGLIQELQNLGISKGYSNVEPLPEGRVSKRFYEILQSYRKQAQLTQFEVAQKLDVNPRSITRWEAGETRPRPSQVRRLAELFNVSVKEFYD